MKKILHFRRKDGMIFDRNENGTFSILLRYENHINHEWSESYLLICKPEIEPVYESCSCHFCVDTYPRMNSILDALPTQELKDSFNTLMSEMQSNQLDLAVAKAELDGEWPRLKARKNSAVTVRESNGIEEFSVS